MNTTINTKKDRPRLLIIDDQPVNIRVLHELFRNDYDVFMATDGLQGLEKCKELLPDVILLDIVMPEMDGNEVCRRLKADSILAPIPVIFVTSHYDEEEEAYGFELGAADFIHKPINSVITKARVKNQLTLKRQTDLLRTIALVDELTDIANRRKFDAELQIDYLQCARDQLPLSLLMIDVDYFKKFNDRYGHQAGDDCLHKIAQTIKQTLSRPYDLAARYGGEEFVCLLPATDAKGAALIAENIQKNIRDLHIEHMDSSVEKYVTLSIGIATMTPTAHSNPNQLISAADQQLYNAKENGRARVCSTTIPPESESTP